MFFFTFYKDKRANKSNEVLLETQFKDGIQNECYHVFANANMTKYQLSKIKYV